MQIIKSIVAFIKKLSVNFCNTFNSTGNVNSDRMAMIHSLKHVKKDFPTGIIVAHFNFLTYYSLFLVYSFLSKIRILYKIQQNFKRFKIIVGTAVKITCSVKESRRICISSCFGILCKSVAIFIFKQFMFKKMRNTLRNDRIFLICFCFEHCINRTVFCTE